MYIGFVTLGWYHDPYSSITEANFSVIVCSIFSYY
jgi:hypothetical protein